MNTTLQAQTRRAFTLPELMIVTLVLSLLMAGLVGFINQSSKMMFTSDAKLRINADIRNITNEMTDNARDANHFTVYDSFYDDFRNPPQGVAHESYRIRDGQSGDLLVLIFYGTDPNPADNVPPSIEKLVGYYRSIHDVASNSGPVRKFTRNVPVAEQSLKVEQIVPAIAQENTFTQVIELSRGLANGKLFYNFRDRSIMINGQIYHGNAAKRVTDTYNFTISPRG